MTERPTEQQPLGDFDGSDDARIPENSEAIARANEPAENLRKRIVGSEEKTSPGTLPGLAGRLMTEAGDLPGKYDPPVALSTHVINTIVTGVNAYVYDRVVRDEGHVEKEPPLLLIAALALHDANKYVEGAYDVDFDTDDNTEEVLDFYFEQGDDFGIERVLPGETEAELELDIADVKWLVQRTETKDTTRSTRGKSTQRVRGLERYCRIGDGFVSKVGTDGLDAATDWLEQMFEESDDSGPHVQYVEFSSLEQSVLNSHLITAAKEIIRGNDEFSDELDSPPTRGLILGSTPDSVAYLGHEIGERDLRDAVERVLMTRITEEHEFNAKTEWRSFEYDILAEVDIPFEKKREIIADGFADTLARGSGTDHEFETVPDRFKEHLPEAAKVVFRDQNYDEAFEEYPSLGRLWEQVDTSEDYNSFTRKIGFLAELLRRYMGSVDDGYDYEEVRAELAGLSEANRDALREDLEPDSSVGRIAVDRFFEGGLATDLELPATEDMCFLCGRPAAQEYKKGNNAFYGTQSYSKRVPAEANYKKICPVCNLEHAILRDTVEDHDYNADEDIKIAFVYYDDFVADLSVRGSNDASGLIRALQGDEDDEELRAAIADPELVASSFSRQYHLQPLYVDGENARLRQVREVLVDLVTRGFKVVIGKPFAGFSPQRALFADLNPTRRQTAYGADRAASFTELARVVRLFEILREVAERSDYQSGREMTQIQRDGFQTIADLVARKSEYGYSVREVAHDHFIQTHKEKYMLMRDVAQKGLDLYGREYGSRHKKTKIFRRAVDATLDGLNRGMSEEQLHEHVTGQVYKAATADAEQDHYVQPEQAEAFVTSLFELLRENDELNKGGLSQRRNTLSNTYLFTYDRLLRELSESDDAEDATEDEEAPA